MNVSQKSQIDHQSLPLHSILKKEGKTQTGKKVRIDLNPISKLVFSKQEFAMNLMNNPKMQEYYISKLTDFPILFKVFFEKFLT